MNGRSEEKSKRGLGGVKYNVLVYYGQQRHEIEFVQTSNHEHLSGGRSERKRADLHDRVQAVRILREDLD